MSRLQSLLLGVFLCLPAGCQTASNKPDFGALLGTDVFGDIQSRAGREHAGYGDLSRAGSQPTQGSSRLFLGSGEPPQPGLAQIASGGGENDKGSYTLNFDNADVKDVIRAVLGDALKLNYTISGNVTGPVTISSARPVNRNELLATLETVLGTLGYSLSHEGSIYRVYPKGVGTGVINGGSRTTPGFGVSIVPLRYVPASTMLELLNGFVTENDSLKIGATKNTIVVRGSGVERAETIRAINSFDADWMQNQSVAIFTLGQSKPESVISELERIFNVEDSKGLIEFRPIPRLRGILAISKNAALLKRADSWVRRLDRDSPIAGQNVFVYKARNRSATELAKVLSGLFGGGSSTASATRSSNRSQRSAGNEFDSGSGSSGADGRVASAFDNSQQESTTFGSSQDQGNGSGDNVAPGVIDLTTQNLNGAEGGVRIGVDQTNNAVVTYADADKYRPILAALRQLDSAPVQVAINVTVAEVKLTDDLRYGVQYFVNTHNLGFNKDQGSISLRDVASNVLQSQIPGFNVAVGSQESPDVIISALDVISDVQILSSPSLVVIENQTASLQVGDEVPITTRQAQNVDNGLAPIINQVEFRDTGIILKVTPRVGQNDAVTMHIEQEISAVASAGDTLTPTISKRRVASDISVQNGQTVLLAGLISSSSMNNRSGIPGTRNLGFFSNLFSTNKKGSSRNELVILIRPSVVRSAQDAATVAAELKAQMYGIGMRQTPLK